MAPSINVDDNNDLIDRCLKGEQKAWDKFYSIYHNRVKEIVSWRKWRFTDAVVEEIVQDVFLDLIKGLKAFKGDSTLLTYVQRITKNKCISALRRETTIKRKGDRDSVSYEDVEYKSTSDLNKPLSPTTFGKPEESFLKLEEGRVVRASLEQLSDKCKEIVIMRYVDELPYEEIASKLSVPVGTVCSRLKRCLIRLSEIYNDMSSGFNVKR
ncbi:MAG TPA: RNA polymerase sigma factor [Candidatus Eremiobacteraeota bacterium]|nr:MAG: ECF RNA polymerase sigma-E factor [bacterium ADurb.Bin363]HPZ09161.1 RNA polymerase sigma factor [Candidatus Eremiobacteraeota bacterium]